MMTPLTSVRALSADTDELYRNWAKKANATPEKETLEDGSDAFWIGSKEAKTVLVYFHGGGYNIPALPGHIDFLVRLVDGMSPSRDGGFAAILLQYDLAPFKPYPHQLAQAATLLNHVRNKLNVPTHNILVGGDSAGANMALGLLSHILHPHPNESVPRVNFQDGEHLRGALLISPWTDPFGTDYNSLKRNENKDVLSTTFLQRWSKLWINGQPYDAYNRPIAAPAGWWDGVSNILEKALITAGADEALLDGVLGFAEQFRKEWKDEKNAVLTVAEDEGHISCIMDPGLGFKPQDVETWVRVEKWMKETLSKSGGSRHA